MPVRALSRLAVPTRTPRPVAGTTPAIGPPPQRAREHRQRAARSLRPLRAPPRAPIAIGLHRAMARARERQRLAARTLRPQRVTQTTIVHGQPAPRVLERQRPVARSLIQPLVPAITIAPGAPPALSARAHQRRAAS